MLYLVQSRLQPPDTSLPFTIMNHGLSFQVPESQIQTNHPPEGVEDATITCWLCSYQPHPSRLECCRCKLCFLPTEKKTTGNPIAWYIGYLNDLQTPEERNTIVDRLTQEFHIIKRNTAVCLRLQNPIVSVVLRQLDSKRQFSVKTADNMESAKKLVQDWRELKKLSTDVQKKLKLLVVNTDGKCKF